VAQVINKYFLNIPGNLNIQAVKNNDFISQLKKTLSICISTHAKSTCYRSGNKGNLTKEDLIVFLGGTNDISRNEAK